MQELEAKKLLEQAFEEAVKDPRMESVRQKYARLKVHHASRRVDTAGNQYYAARQKLEDRCVMLTEEQERRLVIMTASGFGQRNLTVVELEFAQNAVTVSAWAKEGLISQRSAPKAISATLKLLGLN